MSDDLTEVMLYLRDRLDKVESLLYEILSKVDADSEDDDDGQAEDGVIQSIRIK
jgi:hypothetical protein